MPCTYRVHVAPRFHHWITDGYRRLKDHPAMIAGRELAQLCLAYTYEPDPSVARVQGWVDAARVMKILRDYEVTPEQLMLRVAEMVALFTMEPDRCRGQIPENMALGRAVVHLARWRGQGKGQGKNTILATANHIREYGLVAWALNFVRRLNADQERQGELMRRAVDFGD